MDCPLLGQSRRGRASLRAPERSAVLLLDDAGLLEVGLDRTSGPAPPGHCFAFPKPKSASVAWPEGLTSRSTHSFARSGDGARSVPAMGYSATTLSSGGMST